MSSPTDVRRLLDAWLARQVDEAAVAWLRRACDDAASGGAGRAFFMAFSGAPRRVGRSRLDLTPDDSTAATKARTHWHPEHWTVEQAARARLVLSLAPGRADAYRATLDRLFDDADLGELVALYQALPLLPHPDTHVARAAEGLRSNMTAVFEAVALRNAYPSESFTDDQWNQLVLKCLFVDSPLHLVVGLDDRNNPALARMLSDYAHERWAARRAISPELWRCVGPLADDSMLDDLARVLDQGDDVERLAAALSCAKNPRAGRLREAHREIFERIDDDPPSWVGLAARRP